jgi:hypothetical protein
MSYNTCLILTFNWRCDENQTYGHATYYACWLDEQAAAGSHRVFES